MPYVVCAEELEGNWVAHVPDLPACFNSHKERETAISGTPKAIESYLEWSNNHGLRISGLSGPMIVAEVARSWIYEQDYEVNAFFASDRPPLTEAELKEVEKILHATRKDLEHELEDISDEAATTELPGERWSIMGILNHVASAEQWYFDRLGMALSTAELPADPATRLVAVRDHTLASLPALAARIGVVTLSGETWSARKVIRRTLWHERDHTEHIRKIKQRL
ncbi:MAG: DinB family protein [Anaerolineales bacterium]